MPIPTHHNFTFLFENILTLLSDLRQYPLPDKLDPFNRYLSKVFSIFYIGLEKLLRFFIRLVARHEKTQQTDWKALNNAAKIQSTVVPRTETKAVPPAPV